MTYTAKAALFLYPYKTLNAICFIQASSPYRAVNTFHHGYKNQSVNDVYRKGRSLF
jgi:hypothetical protein